MSPITMAGETEIMVWSSAWREICLHTNIGTPFPFLNKVGIWVVKVFTKRESLDFSHKMGGVCEKKRGLF